MKDKRRDLTRRGFIKTSARTGGAFWLMNETRETVAAQIQNQKLPASSVKNEPLEPLDLSPAQWLWYPSERCLPNTFVLFRRALHLNHKPRRATGWIVADSRYLLKVNGERIQWGPAPSDPRYLAADPIDLTDVLQRGENVIGAQVLFYGHGDGTSPIGKPGFLFRLEIVSEDGKQVIASDENWLAHLARAWRPGQYKRWYLRSLQEDFDVRLYPEGWTSPDWKTNEDWLPAMKLDCPPDKTPVTSSYRDYLFDTRAERNVSALRPREIPLLKESIVPALRLAESFSLSWQRPPVEYFESLTPNAFTVIARDIIKDAKNGTWQTRLGPERAAVALNFEFSEQMVGWPRFTIEAPEGTIIELMTQEAHQVGGPVLLNTHFYAWTRFTCRAGVNQFESFDYESFRWLQLHIRNTQGGEIKISDVGIRRRMFPWPAEPKVVCAEDAAVQRLMNACLNTLHNSAQETIVDGMGRERQQYSGDCGHQLHPLLLNFGEKRLPARYLKTYSQGMTVAGYFLDSWPAYDRLSRLAQRELQLTQWGPILDHSVGFNFDCFHYYNYTGDLRALVEPYPRLLRFVKFLMAMQGEDGLLPVENLGVPTVWVDHEAYQQQRHKQCAFNLYAAAMLMHALAPLCHAFNDTATERAVHELGERILAATIKHFWSEQPGIFIVNLPWLDNEKQVRLCDRSLSTAILYDQCPQGKINSALQALAERPREMGFSYPANAGWRLWALAKGGRADVILPEWRSEWATLPSVVLNNTLQENWKAAPDSGAQWSHCAVAPLYVMTMSIAGIKPLEPGFARCEIRPQLADLKHLALTTQTVRGPVDFLARGPLGNREISVSLPSQCEGELVVKKDEQLALPVISSAAELTRYRLPAGKTTTFRLKYS